MAQAGPAVEPVGLDVVVGSLAADLGVLAGPGGKPGGGSNR